MTISERINLHKCGYSKEEINQLIEDEKTANTPVPEETPVENHVENVQNVQPQNAEILNAIKDLTKAIQAQNLQNATQQAPKIEKAEDVLTGALKNL